MKEEVQCLKPIVEANNPMRSSSSTMVSSAAINLPPAHIPFFYGDISEWQTFWDTYVTAVDCKPIPDIQKLTYLLSKLRGNA